MSNESIDNLEPTIKDQSSRLIAMVPNIDFTGWPTINEQARQTMFEAIKQAIEQKARIMLIKGDIDGLKVLNDKYHDRITNDIITATLTAKREVTMATPCQSIFCYRPQAGGDEFEMLIIAPEITNEEIKTKLEQATLVPLPNNQLEFVTSSCAVADKLLSGDEQAETIFFELRDHTDVDLSKRKIEKIQDYLRNTIDQGKKLAIGDYIDLIVNFWGSRRPTNEVLNVILNHLVARARLQILKQR